MQARTSKTIAAGKFISYSNNSELEKYLGCPLQAALNSHIILQRNRKWAKPLNSYLIYKKTKILPAVPIEPEFTKGLFING